MKKRLTLKKTRLKIIQLKKVTFFKMNELKFTEVEIFIFFSFLVGKSFTLFPRNCSYGNGNTGNRYLIRNLYYHLNWHYIFYILAKTTWIDIIHTLCNCAIHYILYYTRLIYILQQFQLVLSVRQF